MRATALGLLSLALLPLVPWPALASPFEHRVLAEINHVRAHPSDYARELRREGADERGGYGGRSAAEDPEAVEDAIDFLMRQAPLPPLREDARIAAAAEAHVRLQGPRGDVGHGAPGSLGQRLQSRGVWAGLAAETISYGQATPREVVRQLIVDSGVPKRGHRLDVFGHAFQLAGVGCGRHAVWGEMCVIDFAGALVRR